MTGVGELLHIHIAKSAGEAMLELEEADLTVGVGIDGDRYATGLGHYSKIPDVREVTLIEIETLEALTRDHDLHIEPAEHRRNLTTRGVALNHLVDRRFRIGDVILEGARLNTPCTYLDKLLGKQTYKPLIHRSGLNCRIITGGRIRQGDAVEAIIS
ncbi:MAG: MOSC domain-containing protein [Acidimicrobiales bacterium]